MLPAPRLPAQARTGPAAQAPAGRCPTPRLGGCWPGPAWTRPLGTRATAHERSERRIALATACQAGRAICPTALARPGRPDVSLGCSPALTLSECLIHPESEVGYSRARPPCGLPAQTTSGATVCRSVRLRHRVPGIAAHWAHAKLDFPVVSQEAQGVGIISERKDKNASSPPKRSLPNWHRAEA